MDGGLRLLDEEAGDGGADQVEDDPDDAQGAVGAEAEVDPIKEDGVMSPEGGVAFPFPRALYTSTVASDEVETDEDLGEIVESRRSPSERKERFGERIDLARAGGAPLPSMLCLLVPLQKHRRTMMGARDTIAAGPDTDGMNRILVSRSNGTVASRVPAEARRDCTIATNCRTYSR
ncbi:MAG: hypothetical protein R3F14_37700 [Polyangiaceae bacterium]